MTISRFFFTALTTVSSITAVAVNASDVKAGKTLRRGDRSLVSSVASCLAIDDLEWKEDDNCYDNSVIKTTVMSAIDAAPTCAGTCPQGDEDCAKLEAALLTGNMGDDGVTPNWRKARKALKLDCFLKTYHNRRCIQNRNFYGHYDLEHAFDFASFQFNTACTAESVVYDVQYQFNMSSCDPSLFDIEVMYWGMHTDVAKATDNLIDKCKSLRTQCLIDDAGSPLDILDIDLDPVCSKQTIISDIASALAGVPCQHTADVEALLIAGFDDEDVRAERKDAKTELIKRCKDNRSDKKCLDKGISFFPTCSEFTVKKDLKREYNNLNGACAHSRKVEAQIITDTDSFAAAIPVLVEMCKNNEPCLSISDLTFDTCTTEGIDATIQAALDATDGCTSTVAVEKTLMTDTYVVKEADAVIKNNYCQPCLGSLDLLEIGKCSYKHVKRAVKKQLANTQCNHDASTEILIHSSYNTESEVKDVIHLGCEAAWQNVVDQLNNDPDRSSSYIDMSATFDNTFMNEYVSGIGFLNTETGNFKGDDQEKHPTIGDGKTREAAQAIKDFRFGAKNAPPSANAKNSVLKADGIIPLNDCASQSIMCCFGRDRQSGDNNGNCGNDDNPDCNDADPGDNTDLCSAGGTVFSGDTEGAVHCHGLVWADDAAHPSNLFKYNNFFYVSFFDHMVTRGYVEKAVDEAAFMCSCTEKLDVIVSRSDCTEIKISKSFTFGLNPSGKTIEISPSTANSNNDLDDLVVKFQECEGIDDNGQKQNNDLAAKANILHKNGILSEVSKNTIDSILVDACP